MFTIQRLVPFTYHFYVTLTHYVKPIIKYKKKLNIISVYVLFLFCREVPAKESVLSKRYGRKDGRN